MTDPVTPIPTRPAASDDARQKANQALLHIFKTNEVVWLVGETFDTPLSSWMILVARRGAQARWMRQRYRYDTADDLLFFLGERPLTDAELADVQRNGTLFNT